MSDVAGLLKQRPEPRRDRFGRYLIGGKPYTRVTTFAETVGDRHNLERWQQRMVALGLVARQDLYAALAATSPDDKDKIGKLCDQAIEAAKGSAGANLGNALHAFTERVDMGEELIIPAPWDKDVAAYKATLEKVGAKLDRRYVERIVAHHTLMVAGTFDRLLELPDLGLVVADVKTGGYLDWVTIAIQLALYANADELYDPVSDTCEPMPFVDRDVAVVIYLPVGQASCTLYTVDIASAWAMVDTVGNVRAWRKRKDLAAPFSAPLEPASDDGMADEMLVERRGWLVRRTEKLRDAGALETLAQHWPTGVPTFKQSDTHDRRQLDLIEQALIATEAAHNVRPPSYDGSGPTEAEFESMICRLRNLPADLLTDVEAKALGVVPPLRAPKFTAEHLTVLDGLVVEAERQHVDRVLSNAVGDDNEMRNAIINYAQSASTNVPAVCSQLNQQQLVLTRTPDNTTWQLQSTQQPVST